MSQRKIPLLLQAISFLILSTYSFSQEAPKEAVTAPPTSAPATPASPATAAPSTGSQSPEISTGSEVSIILSKGRFYPSQIRLRAETATTLIFTTVNKGPGALVIEPANDFAREPAADRMEITRELGSDRITSVSFEPKKGKYSFHDALSGARGEITVE